MPSSLAPFTVTRPPASSSFSGGWLRTRLATARILSRTATAAAWHAVPATTAPRLAHDLLVADPPRRVLQRRRVVAAVVYQRGGVLEDDLVVERERAGREVVAPPDLQAVEAERARGEIEQPLHHEHAVLAARAAHRRHQRLVGEDGRELGVIVGHVVGAEQGALAVDL